MSFNNALICSLIQFPDALRPAFPRLKERLDDPDTGKQVQEGNWGKPEQTPHRRVCCGICLYLLLYIIYHTLCHKSLPALVLGVLASFVTSKTIHQLARRHELLYLLESRWQQQGRSPHVDLPIQ